MVALGYKREDAAKLVRVSEPIKPTDTNGIAIKNTFGRIHGADDEIDGLLDKIVDELDKHNDLESMAVKNPDDFQRLQKTKENIEALRTQVLEKNNQIIQTAEQLLIEKNIQYQIFTHKGGILDGGKYIKILSKPGSKLHETIRRYLSDLDTNSNGEVVFRNNMGLEGDDVLELFFNPLGIKIANVQARQNLTKLEFGISSLQRVLSGQFDSIEFHEIIHLQQHIRRRNMIGSRVYDQRFVNSTNTNVYGVEEIRAYGDTVYREAKKLIKIDIKSSDLDQFLNIVKISKSVISSALQDAKDFYKAILNKQAKLSYSFFVDDFGRSTTDLVYELPDGRSYIKQMVTQREIDLVDDYDQLGLDFQQRNAEIEQIIKQNLIDANTLAYRQLVAYDDLVSRVEKLRSQLGSMEMTGTYQQQLKDINESARKIYAGSKESHPEFTLELEQLDEKNWEYVIRINN